MSLNMKGTSDCGLLFFILVFLMLFYDNSSIGMLSSGRRGINTCRNPDFHYFVYKYRQRE